MIDFGKLYCDLHPNELITNFCFKQTCMVGLCATCICTHTQYHVNNNTTPEYQNIRNTFSSMHEMIRKKVAGLEVQKQRIEKISQFIQTKRKALRQNIEQTRKQAITVVNNFFDKKQKSMLYEMESQEKKMGLHSEQRMQSLLNSLVRQTSLLLISAQELNSHSFLQSYQRIKTQTLLNATKLEDEISRELDRNEDFETIINTNDEYITNIIRVLEQSLHLSFKINRRPVGFKQQSPLIGNQTSCISPEREKKPLQFYSTMHETTTQPIVVPTLTSDQNIFSGITFNNMPEGLKQQTAKFTNYETENGTSKSIILPQSEKTSVIQSGRQNKSFISQMNQYKPIKQISAQVDFFKEKDFNGRPLSQSMMKSSTILNRNNQSQVIITDKPLGYQSSGGGWSNPRQNNHHQSLVENVHHFSQEKRLNNSISQVIYKNQGISNLHQNQGISNLHQLGRNTMQREGHKLSFTPQIYDSGQFSKNGESQVHLSDSKKMKKSGLTLLKVNQSTLRDKPQGQ